MPFVHDFSPVLINLGPIAIRYYSLAYILGILCAYFWLYYLCKHKKISLKRNDLDTLIFAITLGVIVGGRLGYMIFYNPAELFTLTTFKIWEGGMSFHGGLIGVVIATIVFAKLKKYNFFEISDALIIPATIGLFFGRIANFINAELVGRPTTVPWCVIFPNYDNICRHPSQLYEAAKNILLFVGALCILNIQNLKRGILTSYFLIGYGLLRFGVTFLREDVLYFGLSQGQYYSLATAACGIVLYVYVQGKKHEK